uniref:Uncharacterized protein n=1 Tax=Anguilla anguilla TaxID=7936 RepID=A0A0E9Q3A1_ANGAN
MLHGCIATLILYRDRCRCPPIKNFNKYIYVFLLRKLIILSI